MQQYTEDDFQKIISERRTSFFYIIFRLCEEIFWNGILLRKIAKVLEIDAECGAVTGCIADKVLQVTSLENNDLQRQINECRNSKKEKSQSVYRNI